MTDEIWERPMEVEKEGDMIIPSEIQIGSVLCPIEFECQYKFHINLQTNEANLDLRVKSVKVQKTRGIEPERVLNYVLLFGKEYGRIIYNKAYNMVVREIYPKMQF